MTSVYNYAIQQTTAALSLTEKSGEEIRCPAVGRKEKGGGLLVTPATLVQGNDPAQWDEAWYSSYE